MTTWQDAMLPIHSPAELPCPLSQSRHMPMFKCWCVLNLVTATDHIQQTKNDGYCLYLQTEHWYRKTCQIIEHINIAHLQVDSTACSVCCWDVYIVDYKALLHMFCSNCAGTTCTAHRLLNGREWLTGCRVKQQVRVATTAKAYQCIRTADRVDQIAFSVHSYCW